jgi:hypothetical protein
VLVSVGDLRRFSHFERGRGPERLVSQYEGLVDMVLMATGNCLFKRGSSVCIEFTT